VLPSFVGPATPHTRIQKCPGLQTGPAASSNRVDSHPPAWLCFHARILARFRVLPERSPLLTTRRLYLTFGIFYLAQFGVLGIYLPYFPLYLKSLSLTGAQIGALLAFSPVSRFLFPALWGLWADRVGRRKPLILFSLVGSAAAFSLLLWAKRFASVAAVMFLYGFLLVPAIPLVESLAQEEAEKGRFSYGRVRLWGSIGFIVCTLPFGRLLDRGTTGIVVPGILALALLNILSGMALPVGAPPGVDPRPSLRSQLRRADVQGFLAATTLMQTSHGAYYAYYSIHLDRLSFSRTGIGGFWTLAVGAEALIMFASGPLLSKVGTPRLLSACLAVAAVRWGILADCSSAPLLAAAQLLHAFSFGLFHVAAVEHTHRLFPVGLRSSGQSLYSSLTYGLGNLLGFLGSAALVDRIGIPALFGISSAIALTALLLSLRRWGIRGESLSGPGAGPQ